MLISDLQSLSCRYIQSYLKLNEVNSVFNPFEDQSVLPRAGLTVMYRRAHGYTLYALKHAFPTTFQGKGRNRGRMLLIWNYS